VNAPPDMELVFPRPGAVVVECKGEHELSTGDETEQLLAELVEGYELVVIDVSEAEFVDSSFLHGLVKADRASRARGSRVVLQFGTALIVRRAFEISGVLELLEHVGTREEALDAGSPPM
jgi:anti-anti-sigma factor